MNLNLKTCLIVVLLSIGAGEAIGMEVQKKGRGVSDNGTIDSKKLESSTAKTIVKNGPYITITTKIFTPPTNCKFAPFKGKPNLYVDVIAPKGQALRKIKNTKNEIQVMCTFVTNTAGNFPLAVEGNLLETVKRGIGGGTVGGQHWSVQVSSKGDFDLAVCDGLNGSELGDDYEVSRGAVSVANKNDTDGDGTIDNAEDGTNAANQIVGESDMVKLVIRKVTNQNPGGTIDLTITGDTATGGNQVKVWKSPTKVGGVENTRSWNIANVQQWPITLWLEGLKESAKKQDIDVVIKHTLNNVGTQKDEAKITFVWVSKTGSEFSRRTRLEILADDKWKVMPREFKNRWFGELKLNGTGKLPLTADGKGQNVMLMRFQVLPIDALKLSGVKFDITRQSAYRGYFRRIGGQWLLTPIKKHDFPTKPDEANDDPADETDETQPNSTGEMFTIDGPGHPSLTANTALIYDGIALRYNFNEFSRVSFDGNKPSGDGDAGSRCSNKIKWNCLHTWVYQNNSWIRAGSNDIKEGNHIDINNSAP